MKTINHECYVSLEVAKLLKEAGFDLPVMHFYDEFGDGKIPFYSRGAEELQQNMNAFGYYSAPTLEVAQRWLREEHYFHIFVEYDSWNYFCRIDQCEPVCLYKHCEWIHNCKEFSTYEEAQEAGIKKALEIILGKGE